MSVDASLAALPYCGAPPVPAEIWSRWNGDPVLLALLAALAAVAIRRGEPARRRTWFALGWLGLVVLAVSPLCAATSALFSARAAHHLLLIAVVAPMLVAGGLRLPPPAGGATGIRIAAVLQALTLWFWHLPGPYAAALSHDGIYWAMQASLLGGALLFWSGLTAPSAPTGAVLVALLGTTLQMGFLGALITFAAAPLYAPHLGTTAAWGLSALEDQQLGGLLMWVPGGLPYLAAAVLVVARRLAGPEREAARA